MTATVTVAVAVEPTEVEELPALVLLVEAVAVLSPLVVGVLVALVVVVTLVVVALVVVALVVVALVVVALVVVTLVVVLSALHLSFLCSFHQAQAPANSLLKSSGLEPVQPAIHIPAVVIKLV